MSVVATKKKKKKKKKVKSKKKMEIVVTLVGGGSDINRATPYSLDRPGVAGAVLQTHMSLIK